MKDSIHSWLKGDYLSALVKYAREQHGVRLILQTLAKAAGNVVCQKLALPPPAGPIYVGWDITYKCQAHCKFCDRWKQSRPELSMNEVMKVCNQLHELGVHVVSIAGGEPLLHPAIFDVIRRLKQAQIRVALCTNGFALAECADELIKSGADFLHVSLDSPYPQLHDSWRGKPGLYQRAVNGIYEILKRRVTQRPKISVRATIHEMNYRDIPRLLVQWVGVVEGVIFQPLHTCPGNYFQSHDEIQPVKNTQELRMILSEANLGRNYYHSKIADFIQTPESFTQIGCYAGYLFMQLDPFGAVFPCGSQLKKVGDLRSQELHRIWRCKEFEKARAKIRNKRACSCWYSHTGLYNGAVEQILRIWQLGSHQRQTGIEKPMVNTGVLTTD